MGCFCDWDPPVLLLYWCRNSLLLLLQRRRDLLRCRWGESQKEERRCPSRTRTAASRNGPHPARVRPARVRPTRVRPTRVRPTRLCATRLSAAAGSIPECPSTANVYSAAAAGSCFAAGPTSLLQVIATRTFFSHALCDQEFALVYSSYICRLRS